MTRWSVETRSGSGASPTRYGACPVRSPQGRRCRDDDSTGHDGPRRRLQHHPERPWTWLGQTDGRRSSRGPRHTQQPGTRPAGRLRRGLRPVGPMAQITGIRRCPGEHRPGCARPSPGRPFRPRPGRNPDRRLYQPGYAAGLPRPCRRLHHRPELAGPTTTHPPGAGPARRLAQTGRSRPRRPDPPAGTARQTALPNCQPTHTSLNPIPPRTTSSGGGDGGGGGDPS